MRSSAAALVASLMLAGEAIPQDLPPGVLLLSRIRSRTREALARLSNVSCLETVQREYQGPKGKMRPLDTIRLEVLVSGAKEYYASPGDRKFSGAHPVSYIGSGMVSDGFFGLYLRDILVTGTVTFTHKGEEEIAGRRLARYEYRLPPMWSGYRIHVQEGSGTSGLRGSFWADPQTCDVVRLEMIAEEIPPTVPVQELVTNIDYGQVVLEDGKPMLLPISGDLRMVAFSGAISHNRLEFTHCRLFGARSTIHFGAPDDPVETPRFSAAGIDDTLRQLPDGLRIEVSLRSRIHGGMAVGALLDAVVMADVRSRGSVAIPAGSLVRGRLRRLECYRNPLPYFVVAVEFTEVELHGIRHRFSADLLEIRGDANVSQSLSTPTKTRVTEYQTTYSREAVTVVDLPGVATFFVQTNGLDLKPGLRTTWKTRTP